MAENDKDLLYWNIFKFVLVLLLNLGGDVFDNLRQISVFLTSEMNPLCSTTRWISSRLVAGLCGKASDVA